MAFWTPKTPIDTITFNFWKSLSDGFKALEAKKATKPAE